MQTSAVNTDILWRPPSFSTCFYMFLYPFLCFFVAPTIKYADICIYQGIYPGNTQRPMKNQQKNIPAKKP